MRQSALHQPDVGLSWLVRLRWGAAASEMIAVVVTHWALGIELEAVVLLGLICITFGTNLFLVALPSDRPTSTALLGAVVGLDVVTLTALLLLSGGPSNPFSALYFVYVTLAAILLGGRWAWGVLALSIVCFGALFLWSIEVPAISMHGGHGAPNPHAAHAGHAPAGMISGGAGASAHLYGMFVAFAVAGSLIVYFVGRLSKALRWQEKELHEIRERALQSERLASLTTLAAGAAHELGTPLGTIAVLAGELAHQLAERDDERDLTEDAELIRREVGRCRDILDQMSARAGSGVGEAPEQIELRTLVEELMEALGPRRERVVAVIEAAPEIAIIPGRAVLQVLGNLLGNALDASEGSVDLVIEDIDGGLEIRVTDQGEGMDAATLERATDPFFTTKETGSGMGLGLFLSRTIAEGLHGELKLQSSPGEGTTVRFILPKP